MLITRLIRSLFYRSLQCDTNAVHLNQPGGIMDLSAIMKILGPLLEPMIEQTVTGFWPQIDAAIASVTQTDEKLILQALSPVMKSILVTELKKHLA